MNPVPVHGYRFVPERNFGGNDLASYPNKAFDGAFNAVKTPEQCKETCDSLGSACAGFQVNKHLNKCLFKTDFPDKGQWAYIKTGTPRVVFMDHCPDQVSGGMIVEQRVGHLNDLKEIGFGDVKTSPISWVSVPPQHRARCFEKPNFGGQQIAIDGDNATTNNRTCLNKTINGVNWNDKIQSCIIESKVPIDPNARFIQNMNHTHQQACFDGGRNIGRTDKTPGYMYKPCNKGNKWHQWVMMPVPNDPKYFQIKNLHNNLCLDAGGADAVTRKPIYYFADCGQPDNNWRKWERLPGKAGGELIKNKQAARCLDAGGGNSEVYLAEACDANNTWQNWNIVGP